VYALELGNLGLVLHDVIPRGREIEQVRVVFSQEVHQK
jgi:hypothetical protein